MFSLCLPHCYRGIEMEIVHPSLDGQKLFGKFSSRMGLKVCSFACWEPTDKIIIFIISFNLMMRRFKKNGYLN